MIHLAGGLFSYVYNTVWLFVLLLLEQEYSCSYHYFPAVETEACFVQAECVCDVMYHLAGLDRPSRCVKE